MGQAGLDSTICGLWQGFVLVSQKPEKLIILQQN